MSSKTKEPQKWHQVYPQGTKTGDEEQRFFKALARHPKFDWRSVASIATETGLTKKRVEEILYKYFKLGMIFQNPTSEEQWGYWELHKKLLPKKESSIAAKDTKNRIDRAAGITPAAPSPKKAKPKP